jgi:hypothetical protein
MNGAKWKEGISFRARLDRTGVQVRTRTTDRVHSSTISFLLCIFTCISELVLSCKANVCCSLDTSALFDTAISVFLISQTPMFASPYYPLPSVISILLLLVIVPVCHSFISPTYISFLSTAVICCCFCIVHLFSPICIRILLELPGFLDTCTSRVDKAIKVLIPCELLTTCILACPSLSHKSWPMI